LRDFDSRWDFASFVLKRADLRAALDERQQWRVGPAELVVSVWLDPRSTYVLRVRAGWPMRPARRALTLAEVFAATVAGLLKSRYKSSELTRWKARALIESGLVPAPVVVLEPLPASAPLAARSTWTVIESLIAARRLLGEEPGTPLVLSAPWLVLWARGLVDGVDEPVIRSGKRWLERHGPIVRRIETVPGRFGRRAQLWHVQEAQPLSAAASEATGGGDTITDRVLAALGKTTAGAVAVEGVEHAARRAADANGSSAAVTVVEGGSWIWRDPPGQGEERVLADAEALVSVGAVRWIDCEERP
jgi:hypothetical protein